MSLNHQHHVKVLLLIAVIFSICGAGVLAQKRDGFLHKNGGVYFPIGSYELPQSEEELERMAEAGINLVRCGSKADLDRAQAVGMMGWVPLGIQGGPTDQLRTAVVSS